MGKIIKFLLAAILCVFLLGMVIGLIEQYGGVLLVIAIVVGVLALLGSNSSDQSSQANQEPPESVKKAADDKIDKLHVDMED